MKISSLGFWSFFSLFFLIVQFPVIAEIQQTGSGGDFVIARQQTSSSPNTDPVPDVTGGNAGSLISYTETGGNTYSQSGGRTGANGISNLNDGDIGPGNVPDGSYAKPDYGKGAVVMDFGGVRTVTSIAIYHGVTFAERCSFELKDSLGNRIGSWQTLQAGGSNIDAYWLIFDEPVLTNRLILDVSNFYTPSPGTPSFREIQVFSQTVAPPPSEVTVFGTEERTGLSNAATGDSVKLERKSAIPSTPNYSPTPIDTYDVSLISSGEIIIEQGVPGGPYDYNDRIDITSMEIMAERVIIRSPLHLKGTDVKIYARELRFEGAGKIITTPAEQPLPAVGLTSENGLPAGSVTIHADTFIDLSGNNDSKFDLRGGKGQNAKKGAHGEPGTNLPAFTSYSAGPFTFDNGLDDASYTAPAGWVVTRWKDNDGDIQYGLEAWPTDGGDAVPPGQPGDGGDGGSLTTNLPAVTGVYEAGQSGAAGTPDPVAWTSEEDYCRGGIRGFPEKAIHISSSTSNGGFTVHISEDERKETHNGENAQLKTGLAGAAGSKTTVGDEFSWLRPVLLRQVLAGIKDDYLQNRITDASAALAGYSGVIERYREHYTTVTWDGSQFVTVYNWPLGSEMTRFELNQIYDEMQILRQQITAGLDYFGNPNGWVPMLSFEFTKNLFDQEIDRSLDIIYLSRWISRKQDDATVMYAALGTASTRLKDEIDQAKTDFDAAEAALLNLTGEGQSIKTRINSLQQQLQLRDNDLRQDAKENVAPSDWEVGLRGALKVAGTLCEIVPVYQPALGGAGAALNLGADFDPDQPWATVTGGLDITSSTYTAVAASATAQKANKNAVNTADLGAGQRIARLQALGQASSALSNGIKGVSSVLEASKAPASEVEAELSKLRNSDPAYSALVDDIEKMLEDKRVWADKLNRAILQVATLSDTITRNILAVDAMDIASGQQGNLIDPRINAYMKDMERRAFDRLLKYHYYMAKAYEYRLVDRYAGSLDLQPLFERIEEIALDGAPNGTLDASQQGLLKSAYRNVIAQTTEDIVTEYNTSPSTPGGTRSYALNATQITTLNEGDVLKLNLYELPGLFQPQEENVRIVNLEVLQTNGSTPGMTTTPRSGGSYDGSTAYVELLMEHSGVSSIKLDGDVFQFRHYNESTRNAITWISQYEPNLNIISPIPPQAADDSLLRSLITNDANTMLYSRPSAWADLRIWRRGANGGELFGLGSDDPPIVITGVTLRVTFDRVSRSTNPNVRDVNVASQATDGSSISPKFSVSQADRNGRQDGEGRFLRIYDFSGSNVQITAPTIFGSLGFLKWTRNGSDLTPPNATASVAPSADHRLVAVYALMAPVISDSTSETVPYLEPFAYKVRVDFAPETYAASGLPQGLTIDANTGIIAGTASVIGTYTVNLTATNAQGSDTSVLTLYVADLRQKITSTADSGPGSLRDLISSSTPGRALVFDAILDGQTIDLSGSHLLISQDLTIDASALPNGVTISAGGTSRHFQVAGLKTLTLKNLTLTDGNATGDYEDGYGGSIYSVNGNVHLIETTISGCNGGIGGAIFSSNGTLTAIDSTFTGNSALLAAIYKSGGGMSITACTIDNNASDAFTLQEAGTYSFVRSTIAENTGKGIGAYSSKTVVVRNCTIANNGSDGIYDSSSELKLENSIVAGNFGYNEASSAYAAGINLSDYTIPAPNLSPLGYYGGKTRTMRPLEDSPAINGALATPDTPVTDQRGFATYLGLDIGAFQTQLGALGSVDINQDLSTGELPLTVGAVGGLSGTSSNPTLIPDANIVLGGSGENRTVQITPTPGQYGTATITITDNLTGGQASFEINVGSTLPVVHPLWPISPDGSQRTLRDVVARVAEGSTITFEYFNNEDLTSPIVIDKNLTIDGDGHGWRVSLASDGSSRLFEVAEGKTLTIKNMNLSGGIDTDNAGGGAILNRGSLILIDCEVTDCFTPGQGGAIHSLGDLTVIRSVIANNTATGSGGGIFHTGGKLSVINSTIANNATSAQGGGIYSSEETDLIHNTISANAAAEIGGVRVGDQAAVYIENTIIAGNLISLSTPDFGASQNSPIVTGGGNLIGNNQSVTLAFSPGSPNAGNDFVNVAAKLSPLTAKSSPGNNGYNTKQTMLLLPGSPAIEHAVVTAYSPTDDMLGHMRGSSPDIGAIEGAVLYLWAFEDSDSDGIPDIIESAYPLMTVGVDDRLLDSDGDSWTDIEELRNMTDPANGSNFLEIVSVGSDPLGVPNTLQVTFVSFPGLSYQFAGSSDLTSWADIPSIWTYAYSQGLTTTLRVALPEGINFIRLKRRN